MWTPSRAYRSKSGKASRPIVNVPSAAVTSICAMPTRGSIARQFTPSCYRNLPRGVATVDDAELFLYPGDQHYFADSSLPSYDPEATALLLNWVLEFLARV